MNVLLLRMAERFETDAEDAVKRFTALIEPVLLSLIHILYRSMGNSKVSMYTSLVMNGLNIAGNAICIFGLHMGVEGVAIPTFLSRAFAAVLMMYLIQRPANVIRIHNVKELRFDGGMIKNILRVGVPNGMENAKMCIRDRRSGAGDYPDYCFLSGLPEIYYRGRGCRRCKRLRRR